MVLKGFEGGKGGTAGEELVGELGLVVALLELVVVFLGVACSDRASVSFGLPMRALWAVAVVKLLEELMMGHYRRR